MQSDTTLSWWYRYKKYVWMFLLVLFLLSFTVFVVCSYVFNLSWTGFNESKGPNVLQYQPTKTVWDWLQLLVIPVVLSIAAYWFNRVNNQTEQKMTVQRDETEHAIALDSQREELLQDYLDRMSDLLLVHNLRNSQAYSEVRNIARARTLTILPRLDDKRKGSLIQFLYESHLIASGKESCILLHDANLSGADLTGFNLSGANLSGTDLREAKLSETNLSDAQLKEICLHKANLSGAIMVAHSVKTQKEGSIRATFLLQLLYS